VALYDPAEHEPLAAIRWSAEGALAALDGLVAAAAASIRQGPSQDHSLWTGTAGTLWALDRLGPGLGEHGPPASHEAPAGAGGRGLMTGETGALLVSWRLAPTPEREERLHELVAGNLANLENELFNGNPGTMLAALHLHEQTGAERWRALWSRCADAVWEGFRRDPEHGCRLWIQNRRGRLIRSIGAGHGFASNAHSLLRGAALLPPERAAELARCASETAAALAIREDGLANWPTAADPYWAEQFPTRVQWCHGAPGLITSLATLPRDNALDELLADAGELVWRAGPLRKGAGLCHGTAGNGCAFLALHARTGEELWAERARAFAMHALEQAARAPADESLWTGRAGVAFYLRACLDGWEGMPVLDVL
jgi:hypothetical protein